MDTTSLKSFNNNNMKERFVITTGKVILCGSNSRVALQKVLDTFMNLDLIYSYRIIANEDLNDELKSSNYFIVAE
jgi:hypothetical protein